MSLTAVPTDRFRHDPLSLLLPGARGWEGTLDGLVAIPAGGPVRLAREPGAVGFGGPEASLGGLVPPAHVALDPAGNLFLLHRAAARLHLLDPCDCRLAPVPAFGGQGGGPRQLQDPRAVAAGRRSLYVADTGNRRVTVLTIGDYQLRGHWRPPGPGGWMPVDVAVSRRGRLLVADALGGRVHAFTAAGRHLGVAVDGVPGAARVTVDAADRLYVGVPGETAVRVFSPDGSPEASVLDPEELAGRFPALPFQVRPDGSIDLGPGGAERCAIGPALERVDPPPSQALRYRSAGRLVSAQLDSRLPGCQWHRVVVTGRLVQGTSFRVRTATSEVAVPGEPPAPDDRRWSRRVDLRPAVNGREGEARWDAIVLAPPGRHLWLELELRGDGTASPEVAFVEVEFPRISLRRHLPAVFGENPQAREFLDRFLAVFDTGFRSVEQQLDQQAAWFDLRSAPAGGNGPDVLGWLASWIGLAADPQLPTARRRAFLLAARDALPRRGTAASLGQVVLSWLGMDTAGRPCAPCPPRRCEPTRRPCGVAGLQEPAWQPPTVILEHFRLRRWLFLGAGRIGDQAHLWGARIVNRSQLDASARTDTTQLISTHDPQRDPFHHYSHRFSVFVPARLVADQRQRRTLARLVRQESPAHTQFQLEAVEPRFRIGVQSMIGLDAVVGRWPGRAVLAGGDDPSTDSSRLGRAVLPAPPVHEAGLRIGRGAQTGLTTRL